jgi:hypothetical protein
MFQQIDNLERSESMENNQENKSEIVKKVVVRASLEELQQKVDGLKAHLLKIQALPPCKWVNIGNGSLRT